MYRSQQSRTTILHIVVNKGYLESSKFQTLFFQHRNKAEMDYRKLISMYIKGFNTGNHGFKKQNSALKREKLLNNF